MDDGIYIVHRINSEVIEATQTNQAFGLSDEYIQEVAENGTVVFYQSFETAKGHESVTVYFYVNW